MMSKKIVERVRPGLPATGFSSLGAAPFRGRVALLATMHSKETVIGPILEEALGLRVTTLAGFETDRFGTFTGEVARAGTQLEAAGRKIEAAFLAAPEVTLALASEGSFGPHPSIPFVTGGLELVLLRDRVRGLEIAGWDLTTETNYAQTVVTSMPDAREFATRAQFPTHALALLGADVRKGIGSAQEFEKLVGDALDRAGSAHLQTDMRAHLNPTRREAIARATLDLARKAQGLCPQCQRPGFDVVERERGLPCADCGAPTRLVLREVFACSGCGFQEKRSAVHGQPSASPAQCDYCNP